MQVRCTWVGSDLLMKAYHDQEWGVPLHNDRLLFEYLLLEGAQAGLSWSIILRKREIYRAVFDAFNPYKIAQYDEYKIARLLSNPGIIRNKRKIRGAIQNAQQFITIISECGSFDQYIWKFVNYHPIQHSYNSMLEYPTKIRESEIMSTELVTKGFSFVGPTICYAFMQAVGMVNAHQLTCFRNKQV